MNKQEFVQKLRDFAAVEQQWSGRNSEFAEYLADYIERLDFSYFEEFNRDIEDKLQQIVVGAINEIRRLRAAPDTEYGQTDKIDGFDDDRRIQGLDVYGAPMVLSVIREVTGSKAITEHLDKVLRPDWHAIHAAFFRFLDEAYARGFYQEVRDNYPATTVKKFGATTLAGWEFTGRVCVKFVRGDMDNHPDQVIVFTCDTGDVNGYGGGLTAQYSDPATAVAMIDDVIAGWPAHSQMST